MARFAQSGSTSEAPVSRPACVVGIRRYEPGDAEALFEAASESVEHIFPWLEWCHPGYRLQEASEWVKRCAALWKDDREYNFAIVNKSNRILGGCGLNQLRHEHRLANLGYWVRTSEILRGVATAAVRELTHFAFSETNLIRLEIVVAVANKASQRVAEKAGAVREGVLTARLMLHGKPHDAVLYALLRPERSGHRETNEGSLRGETGS
jgi:RimJ/RimL family protein N-acetyltransferase